MQIFDDLRQGMYIRVHIHEYTLTYTYMYTYMRIIHMNIL